MGGITAKRSLGVETLARLDAAIRESLHYGYAHRAEAQPYIAEHASEMDRAVMQRHIDLYVNELSFDVGKTGERAVTELYRRGRARGLVPDAREPLFFGA